MDAFPPVPETAVRGTAPSPHAGMGARPLVSGTSFRVWAPCAESVAVAGSFNRWSTEATPLAAEGNGYWSAHVPVARAGDEYKYVVVNQATLRRNDPYARELVHSAGNAIIHDPTFVWGDTGYRMPPWDELVIYELHAGTFNDEPGGAPGNFNGVIRKLGYLRELGVNAIEVMPAMEFAADFSWGYNPAYIFSIERAYGGPRALKRLVEAAHALGIAVILDVVYNHFGPSDLGGGLWQFDGWSRDGQGGIYFYNDWRRTTPWGETRPDYGRDEVRQYLRDNALLWLEECRADGLRWDATAYIRNVDGGADPGRDLPDGWRLMQRINGEIDARQPWKLSIAEDLRNNEWLTQGVDAGGAGFDAQWDAGFVHPVRDALITPRDEARDMHALGRAIAHRYNGDALRRVIYTESHDEVANGKARVPHEIWPANAGSWFSRKRSTLGAALVFTAPGIPMIFQGQEFLEDEWFHDADPIDWGKRERYHGIWLLYRDLIRLRRNWFDTTRGLRGAQVNVHHLNDQDKCLAFHRWQHGGPGDDVVIAVNAANRSYDAYRIGLPRGGAWRVRFNSDWVGYSPDFGNHASADVVATAEGRDGLPFSGAIGIGPYTAIILSQDR